MSKAGMPSFCPVCHLDTCPCSTLQRLANRWLASPWACCRLSELVATDLGKSVGSNAGLVLIHYDVKLSGEAITAPHLRIPPFQEKAYEKMVSSLLEARSQTVNADCKPVLNLDARAL